MTSSNINVCIKIRPLIQREKNDNLPSLWSLVDEKTIKSQNKEYKLSFDHIFDENKTTAELFDSVAKPIVSNAVKGINGTIFAYGQTSSGKTYCMMGTDEEPGIIPLTINEIFRQIEQIKDREFLIRVGYIEIYNEKIYDLMQEKQEITKFHEANGEVQINQTEYLSSSPHEIIDYYNKGSKGRSVGETCMNDRSSRSHTIFRIVIESHESGNDGVFQVSTLNLVDLAGSERVDQTKATGERLREGGHINKSLLFLSKVIRELSDMTDDKNKNVDGVKYINYRESKLTRILSASLGGNAMTAIICTITPCSLEETYSTLTFASNAKKIKNQPKVNETISDKVMMARLQKEIAALRNELTEERSKKSEESKIEQLIAKIFDREKQIIHLHPQPISTAIHLNRRKTWAPLSHMEKIHEEPILKKSPLVTAPPFVLNQDPLSTHAEVDFSPDDDFLANEVFRSPDKAIFGEGIFLSPTKRDYRMPSQFHTPKTLKPIAEVDSPVIGKLSIEEENQVLKKRIDYLQEELDELNYFKAIENDVNSNPQEENKIVDDMLNDFRTQLANAHCKIETLENDIADKMIEIESLRSLKDQCEAMTIECKNAIEERDKAQNQLHSVEYEYDMAKTKFKNREAELIQSLNESRNETSDIVNVQKDKIKSLEELLRKAEEDLFLIESQRKIKGSTADLENKIKELENKLEIANMHRETSEKALNEKKLEIETLSDQIMESIEDTENMQKKIVQLEDDLKTKDNDIEKVQNEASVEIEKLKMKISEMEGLIKNHETGREELEKRLSGHEEIVDQFQKIKDTLENMEGYKDLDENMNVCDIVSKLHQNITKVKELEAEVERFERIQQVLASNDPISEDNFDDNFGKMIYKLQQTANRSETLEHEKMQLLVEISEIRESAHILSERLAANQTITETEFQLREKIDTLQEELKEAKNQLEEQLAKNDEIESSVLDIKIKIEETLKDKDELASQVVELKTSIEDKNNDLMNLQEKLDQAVAKAQSCEDEISKLTSMLNEIKQQNTEYAAEISKLQAELKDNQSIGSDTEHLQKLQLDLDEKISKVHECETQITALTSELEDIKAENKKLIESNDQHATEAIQKLQMDLDEKIAKIQSHELQISELASKLDENKNDEPTADVIHKLQQELDGTNAKISEYDQQILALSSKLDELNDENQKLAESNNQKAAEAMQKLQMELDEKVQSYESQISELTLKLEENKEIIDSNDTVQKLQQELDAKAAKVSEYESDISTLTSQMNENREAIEKLRVELEESTAKIQTYELEISKLTSKLEENKDEETAQKIKEELDTATDKIHEYELKISTLSSQLEESTKLLEANDQHVAEVQQKLQLELDGANEIIQSYKLNISELTTHLENAKEENKKLAESNELQASEAMQKLQMEHDEKVQSYEQEIFALTSKLADYNNERAAEIQEMQQLKLEFDETAAKVSKFELEVSALTSTIEELKNENRQLCEANDVAASSAMQKLRAELDECDAKIQSYESEIHKMTSKMADIKEQNTKLIDSNAECAAELSKLNAELTNCRSQLVIKDEDFKTLQSQLVQAVEQLKVKSQECDELKTRYRRRSEDNSRKVQELEIANSKLLQDVGAAEAIKNSIENELKRMKEEQNRVIAENKVLAEKNNDNDMKYAILDEKYSQLYTIKMELENKLKEKIAVESKCSDVQKKLENEIIELTKKIYQKTVESDERKQMMDNLSEKYEKLVKEVDEKKLKPKKSSSPQAPHRRSEEEKELFSALRLETENNHGTPARAVRSNIDRKSRRQSVYDERRDLSAWELTQSESTQTDPIDKLCACEDLAEKVKALQIEIRLRDCKIANAQRMANVNIYKYQLEDAQKECQQKKRENGQLKEVIEGLKSKNHSIQMKLQELELNQKCLNINNRCSQTDTLDVVEKAEYEKMVTEKNTLEKKLVETKRQLSQEKMMSEKENVHINNNFQSSTDSGISDSYRKDYESLNTEYKKLQGKYDIAKRLCNLRQDDLAKARAELHEKTSEAAVMKVKYEKAKEILNIRMEKIRVLREQLGLKDEMAKENFGDSVESTRSD